jgi:hypothetical protein
MIRPTEHGCDLEDLSYAEVRDGYVWCRECARSWVLLKGSGSWVRWWVSEPVSGPWVTIGGEYVHRLTGEVYGPGIHHSACSEEKSSWSQDEERSRGANPGPFATARP